MELRHLRAFVAVADQRSFTRAADELQVVQSAVSASIRGLEQELGIAVFTRTTQRVDLTDAGRALLPEARRALAALDGGRQAVEQVRGGLRGRVEVGTMQAQAMRAVSVAAIVARFRRDHPAVEVRVRHTGASADSVAMVADGRLELAFAAFTGRPPAGAALHRLDSEEMQLACAPDHPLAGRANVTWAQLADEPFVDLLLGWGTRMAADRAAAAAGVERRIVYELNDAESIIDFTRHGLAVALLPPSLARRAAGVVFVPIARGAPHFTTSLVLPDDRPRSPAAVALAEIALASVRR
ncbi:MAG TPA: LysR substrate-binding domain-containing protein [Conexibacter sp.]|nr:LysR substrate-binding domain-containing protein [Conexibacter sp.]